MAEKNFSRVVVVLNSPNPMELGRMNDDAVGAVLWVGTPGATCLLYTSPSPRDCS